MEALMRKFVVVLFLLCAAVSPSALRASNIDYHFSYTGLSNGQPNFSFDIITPGFITTTGFFTLTTPDPTSLGYTIVNYGEDTEGFFAFSNAGGSISNTPGGEVGFSGTTFDFNPNVKQTDYYQTFGTFSGTAIGNDPSFASPFFNATATLTITPEPSTIGLLGTGLSGLMYFGRRRFFRS
jgi:hypothetical protein